MSSRIGIVASGGGAKGAWQVGALRYIAENNIAPEGVDFVSGSSIGALFVSAIASQPRSESQLILACETLIKIWDSISTNKDVWTQRFPAWIAGLWNPSIGKNDRLRSLITNHLDVEALKSSGVQWRISSVDLLRGELRYFGQDFPDIISAIVASASVPILFPPEHIGLGLYTDGGILDYAPLKPAILNDCTHVIVLCCADPYRIIEAKEKDLKSVIDVGMRCLEIIQHDLLRQDIAKCQRTNRKVWEIGFDEKRLVELDVIYPSKPLVHSMYFSKKEIQQYLEQGYEDAKAFYQRKL